MAAAPAPAPLAPGREDSFRVVTPRELGNRQRTVRLYLPKEIDRRYRTLREPEHTGIGGSSMGGLIART